MQTFTVIPNIKELSGYQVLERGESVISKAIIKHMRIYARQHGYEPVDASHMETLIWDERKKVLVTTGAREKGPEITPVDEYYTKGHQLILLEPVVPFTYDDNIIALAYAEMIDDRKYQYRGLIDWITEIKTFGLIKPYRKGDITLYCYEQNGRICKIVKRWPGTAVNGIKSWNLDKGVSIYHHLRNPYYKTSNGIIQ